MERELRQLPMSCCSNEACGGEENACSDAQRCGQVVNDPEAVAATTTAASIAYASDAALPWVTGSVDTPAGPLFRVKTRLTWRDLAGAFKARLGLGRMNYRIPPGLYAVGNPGPAAPVLVSANYKLSFDYLRRELSRLDLWIMVIDTNGVNVWCAAGKGTFGTEEIVRRIRLTRLDQLVSHRTVILPQLGAPGVAAHEVKKQAGFRVIYGPVRAADIPGFLAAGLVATPAMRAVRFNLSDRLVLTPLELVNLLKPALAIFFVLFVVNLFAMGLLTAGQLFRQTFYDFIPYLGAILVGAVLVPALLPYIPGRAFAWKGWLAGLLWTLAYLAVIFPGAGWLQAASHLLLLPAIASFLALNYTGSTTYTSLSGVLKEMGVALPAILISAGLGVICFVAGLFFRPYFGI